ncbi:hypothetical protein, partial [Veillonella seminalis]|uniref:hypothetical protein n=1 Tax=Veillonella seminalis TaxID=1502943 RepID=UPI0023F34EE3
SFNHSEITLLSNHRIIRRGMLRVLITQKLHYSQTPNCIFTQNTEFKDLREFSAYEAGVILASQLKHA